MEQSDWELVRQCKSGDRQAFRELVERYQRKAVAIAFGILHDREDALEVAQEAFAKVFTGIQKFKEEASFYTWLYRITVNLAIDRQRQKNRQPLLEREDSREGENARTARIEGIPDSAEADPYEQVKDKELGERIRVALAELTPAHKAVILLREVEGLSYEEISEVLQCSRGTVMSRLHYARKKLQSRLRRDL
ncbi:MAG: sigma-70 family RNA polymerase sigma factor [Candidatus Binatia bacterium]